MRTRRGGYPASLATAVGGLLVTAVVVTGQQTSAGGQAAETSVAQQPAVKPGAYVRRPPVPIHDGPAPLRADWPGLIAGGASETASESGEALYNITEPSYTAFIPEAGRNTRTAVIVAPGGGFRQLSINSEGNRVAEWLAERGVAAFVVKYRLVQQPGPKFTMMARMQDMPMDVAGEPAVADTLRTIALVREKAAEYAVDPSKVVAIGFSAGAHAVAHAALARDVAARPNYVAPIYGAPFGGIPPIPASDAADRLPPVFLAMAQDDSLVGNDVREFYTRLYDAGYRPELHLYMSGGHGFGMNRTNHPSDLYIDQFFMWMQAQGLTRKPGDPDLVPRGRGTFGPGRAGGSLN